MLLPRICRVCLEGWGLWLNLPSSSCSIWLRTWRVDFINSIHSQRDYCLPWFLKCFRCVSNSAFSFLFLIPFRHSSKGQQLHSSDCSTQKSEVLQTAPFMHIPHPIPLKGCWVFLQKISKNRWVSHLISQSLCFPICSMGMSTPRDLLERLNDIEIRQSVR